MKDFLFSWKLVKKCCENEFVNTVILFYRFKSNTCNLGKLFKKQIQNVTMYAHEYLILCLGQFYNKIESGILYLVNILKTTRCQHQKLEK